MDVEHRVVIASYFTSVPPTCFNSFHITEKSQRPSAARDAVEFFQLLRSWEKPQGAAEGAPWGRESRHPKLASIGRDAWQLQRVRPRGARRARATAQADLGQCARGTRALGARPT